MKDICLNGVWKVRAEPMDCIGEAGLRGVLAAADGWLEAQVPGEIHLDLMRAGRMPEPSVGANMPECRWPETKSWWYRTAFEVDEAFLALECQELVFDGLDLYAQVFVNGKLAGESRNAFVPARFDVRGRLRAGANDLVVRLTAGSELALAARLRASVPDGVIRGDLVLPEEWSLFGPFAADAPEPAIGGLTSVPSELVAGLERVTARHVHLSDGRLELGSLLGGGQVGKIAYVVAEIDTNEAAEVTLGAGADWWMKWWVNGEVACDTMDTGNGRAPVSGDNHIFNMRLRQGRNVVAVKVRSGGGFVLAIGEPRELREALSPARCRIPWIRTAHTRTECGPTVAGSASRSSPTVGTGWTRCPTSASGAACISRGTRMPCSTTCGSTRSAMATPSTWPWKPLSAISIHMRSGAADSMWRSRRRMDMTGRGGTMTSPSCPVWRL
ncbi:MAG: hypothetical protein PHR35_08070 [Kiritimatiellae bacterium]|nr:hypothetical protein [Kiritimatiellia bacterium]